MSNSDEIVSDLSGPTQVQTKISTDDQNITKFSDDTLGVVSQPVEESKFPTVPFLDIPGSDSIISFLERPTLLGQGNFTMTDSTFLLNLDPFFALVSGTKAPKLAGIYGIKADVHVTLNVNATRFQTGRYILGFMPSGGPPISSASFVAAWKSHATTLVNITQLPHVEIDIATQTHAEIDLPWTSVAPFFVNLSTYPVGFGALFLRPYVPLATGAGDSIASYSLWASFKNVSLVGPTYTQSSRVGNKEAKKSGIGPVSSALSKISRASSILGEFPILTPATSGVSWSADILARAANVFGWSKPMQLSAPDSHIITPHKFLENVDGASTAKTLGVMSTNSLDPVPCNVTTKIDEMSIDYIKQIYSYYQTISWDATSTAGTALLRLPVLPSLTTNYGSGVIATPIGFLSRIFRLWRGSLRYRFKFVKNEFYSGRLAFYFEPNFLGASYSLTLNASEFSNRVIVDIRESSEIEFVVPYISPQLYTKVGVSTGRLHVVVVDPLVAPDSVPTVLSIILEVSAAPDFEFASPQNPHIEPWIPFTTQSGRAASSYQKLPTFTLGQAKQTNTIIPASIAIGEKVESLRQVWRIPTLLTPVSVSPIITATSSKCTYWSPFNMTVVTQVTSITGALGRSYFFCDLVDMISQCFLYATGSMRITINDSTATSWLIGTNFYTSTTPLFSDSVAVYTGLNAKGLVKGSLGEPFDVVLPPYQQTMGRSVIGHLRTEGIPTLAPAANYTVQAVLEAVPLTTTSITTYRTPADDANCWGFLSIPAFVLQTQA